MWRGVVAAVAVICAVSAAPATDGAAPPRLAYECGLSRGLTLTLDPRDRRLTVADGRTVVDGPTAKPETGILRTVAVVTATRASFATGCRRVGGRAPGTARLLGPYVGTVYSKVVCGVLGPRVRFDALPLRGGGYRLTVSVARRATATATVRPRNRGGIWLDSSLCERFSS